jgi:hypothetical protein
MNYKIIRMTINRHLNSFESSKRFLGQNIGIDVTRSGYFKVRIDDKNPSCIINKNGSFHDFGSGNHYKDMVSLLFDGYRAFDSLSDTMEWICKELNINLEMCNE